MVDLVNEVFSTLRGKRSIGRHKILTDPKVSEGPPVGGL
jgi:hypothetical protein